jgi:hypothetical protein
MSDDVVDFAAYKAKMAEAKATPTGGATIATTPASERAVQAFTEYAAAISRLSTQLAKGSALDIPYAGGWARLLER